MNNDYYSNGGGVTNVTPSNDYNDKPSFMNYTGVEQSSLTPSDNLYGGNTMPNIMPENRNAIKSGDNMGSFNTPLNSNISYGNLMSFDVGFYDKEDIKPVPIMETVPLNPEEEIKIEDTSKEEIIEEKKSGKGIIVLLIIIIIILIVLIFLLLYRPFSRNTLEINTSNNTNKIIEEENIPAFFIKGNNDKYALFNYNGDKLSDFIYTNTTSFINGRSVVSIDCEYGVIDNRGKTIIDFGKYIDITRVSGLFKVNNQIYDEYLFNNDGKLIYDLKNRSLEIPLNSNEYIVLYDEPNNKYILFGYDGKELLSLDKVVDEEPSTNIYGDYLSFYYSNMTHIFNIKTLEKVISFSSVKHYCINGVSKDGNIITLNSCSKDNKDEAIYFKFVVDKNMYDFSSQCQKVIYKDSNLICLKDGGAYLITDDYKIGLNIDKDNIEYVNSYNYSIDTNNSVSFYKDNNIVNNIEGFKNAFKGYIKDFYVLENDNKLYLFNLNGEKISDTSYMFVDKIDDNNLYKVNEIENKFYLINSLGKKISDIYDSIDYVLDYYIVSNDSKYGIIDSNGNIILNLEYDKVDIVNVNDKIYAKVENKDSYIVYSITDNKNIYKGNSKPLLNNNYILVVENGKNKYYSYNNGNKFYEL